MKTTDHEPQKTLLTHHEPSARPLARLTAREISAKELAAISGGFLYPTNEYHRSAYDSGVTGSPPSWQPA